MQRYTLVAMLSGGLILGSIGCSGGKSDYKKTTELKKAPAAKEHAHEHGAKGPHGGGLIELGEEEFHGEVVVDHDDHAVRVFLLGKDAKTAATTTAKEVTLTPKGKDALKLTAKPQAGDGEGKTSQFELVDDKIVHELMDAGFIHGVLRVTIGDKPYTGDVDYHLDGDHDHKDEAKGDHKDHKDHKDGDHKDGDHKDEHKDEKPAAKEEAKDKPAEAAKDSK